MINRDLRGLCVVWLLVFIVGAASVAFIDHEINKRLQSNPIILERNK